ncbi:hypothetical protein [Burkholderia cenocepacia]|uniref:hypothetical protein n=1 Tax=Burkholderia cenocepacia TaxID=95486 RepID=UPI0020111176|nr:hypothetical protein [Burkholderia cenocepacia]
MTPEGRKIWQSQAGVSLLEQLASGEPLTPEQAQTVEQLKRSGPPDRAKLPVTTTQTSAPVTNPEH